MKAGGGHPSTKEGVSEGQVGLTSRKPYRGGGRAAGSRFSGEKLWTSQGEEKTTQMGAACLWLSAEKRWTRRAAVKKAGSTVKISHKLRKSEKTYR